MKIAIICTYVNMTHWLFFISVRDHYAFSAFVMLDCWLGGKLGILLTVTLVTLCSVCLLYMYVWV